MFGVLGDPVDHSLSPAMQNAAFAASGLPHLYLRYRVTRAELATALGEARRLRMGGLNLTVPLKEEALPLLDALTPAALRMGAVNTVSLAGPRLTGDNTDGAGFVAALAPRLRIRRTPVLLLGAGGSARAVAIALGDARCPRITIANRTPERAERLARDLADEGIAAEVVPLGEATRALALDVGLVVNTTSAGLDGSSLPLDPRRSAAACLFVDLVYGTLTPFLAAAQRAGRRAFDGGLMLLHQGALAFSTWTGLPAPLGAMADALRAAGLALPEPIGGGIHTP